MDLNIVILPVYLTTDLYNSNYYIILTVNNYRKFQVI